MFTYPLSRHSKSKAQLVFLHGWGADARSLLPLAHLLKDEFDVYMSDLAGFGQAEQPPAVWTTFDYAKDLESFLKTLPDKKTILIGHSFGGRVAIQAGALSIKKIAGIVLVGGAGFPLPKSFIKKVYLWGLSLIPRCIKDLPFIQRCARGSADYNASSAIMRQILKNVVNEDLTETAKKITVPTLLLYGQNDTATPPAFGEKYHHLITPSWLYIFPENDHFSLLFQNYNLTYQKIHYFLKREILK